MTLEEYSLAIERELAKTAFYDTIILFCGPRHSDTYRSVVESIAEAVYRAYISNTPVEKAVAVLMEANENSVKYLMAKDKSTRH